ncbi:MAG: hypothetical protein ACK4UO_09240 [Pseudolabrys sp.]
MRDPTNGPAFRRLADECTDKAARNDCIDAERERLLTMRDALLALAKNADWLTGRSPPRSAA